ncbi:F0F1 ATP synthase subunit gamma, partial [Vibrio parahaemolyticus]
MAGAKEIRNKIGSVKKHAENYESDGMVAAS